MIRILSVLAAGAALLIAGCGGSSSSSSSTASFAAQANAICAAEGAKIVALPAPGNDLASQGASLEAQLPIIQEELTKLKALTPPSGQEALWKSTLSDLDQSTALIPQVVAAAKAGDTAKVNALATQATPLTNSATAAAKKLGLTACAADYQPGSSSTQTSSS